MGSVLRVRRGWMAFGLAAICGTYGCEPVEPETRLRFSPSGLTVQVGGSGDFSGLVSLGTPSGTWFVQPNSITIAQIEITGPLVGRLTCFQQGAGSFVLSTLTTQGMASGSLYFVCVT